jgi:hypothetical protein
MIIAVDFDGTIVKNDFPGIGDELPGAIQTLKDLQDADHKIILWTCRCGYELAGALDWLHFKGFVADAVNSNLGARSGFAVPKIFADAYLDDSSIPSFTVLGWEFVRRTFRLPPLPADSKPEQEAEKQGRGAQEQPIEPQAKAGEPPK